MSRCEFCASSCGSARTQLASRSLTRCNATGINVSEVHSWIGFQPELLSVTQFGIEFQHEVVSATHFGIGFQPELVSVTELLIEFQPELVSTTPVGSEFQPELASTTHFRDLFPTRGSIDETFLD
jgi:hypothetical protein